MAKIIKSKKLNEHVYWILYKYTETVEVKDENDNTVYENDIAKTETTGEQEGWTFITAPSMILSQAQLWSLQSQIAKEGKFDKCLIKDFNLLISR